MVKPSSTSGRSRPSLEKTSAKKTLGDLPPSSSVTGMRFSEAYLHDEPGPSSSHP
jgi:hypothetical protein